MHLIARILVTLLAVALLLISTLLLVLVVDPGRVKGGLEYLVTQQTGRDFTINGRLDFHFGRQAGLTAGDIHFGNADWGIAPEMVRVGKAEIVVDLWSLVRGPILIERVKIDRAFVALETSATGEHNWDLTSGTGNESDDDDDSDDEAFDFLLHFARIENSALTYVAPQQIRPLQIQVDLFEQAQAENDSLSATLKGSINSKPVRIDGHYGPFQSLLTGRNLNYDVTGQFDTLTIASKGMLDDLVSPRRPDVELRINGPDIGHVTRMLDLPDLGTGTMDLTASIKPVDGALEAKIAGNLGQFLVEFDGEVSDLTRLEKLDADLTVSGPDLGVAAELFGLADVPADPFDVTAKVTRSGRNLTIDKAVLHLGGARILLDGTLNDFPKLHDANLNLQISGSDLARFKRLFNLPGNAVGPFEVAGNLKVSPDGKELVGITMKTSIAQLDIQGTITEPPAFVGSRIKYSGKGDNLQQFGTTYGYPQLIAEPFEIRGEIEVASDQLITQETIHVRVGNNQLDIDGSIGFEPLSSGTSVRIQARGPDLSELLGMAGITDDVPAKTYAITARLNIEDDGYRIENLRGTIGDARMSLDGTLSKSADWVGTDIRFTASGPDLREALAQIEDLEPPPGPFEASGRFRLRADEIRVDEGKFTVGGAALRFDIGVGTPLDFSDLNRSHGDLDLTLDAPDIRAMLPDMEIWKPDAAALQVRVHGSWRNERWSFDPVLIALGDAKLRFSGELDQPPDWSATEMALDINVADLARLGLINGRRLPATPLALNAHFSGTPDTFEMDGLTGTLGRSDFSGTLALTTGNGIPEIDIDIDSNLLDFSQLLAAEPEPGDEEPESLLEEVEESTTDKFVIPDWELPLERLKTFNARISIDAQNLQLTTVALNHFALHADIRDGALKVDRIAAKGPDGDVMGTLSIEPVTNGATVATTMQGSNLYFGLVTGRTEEAAALAPRFDVDITLSGTGLTLRDVTSSLNGRVKVTSDGGRVEGTSLQFMYGSFFEELLSAVIPFIKKDPDTTLVCLAFFVDAEDGLIQADPSLVMQTGKMNIISKGTLNLKTEKIDLNFKTAARKGIGISAGEFINPYIKVGGTLGDPAIVLDKKGAAFHGGAAVATLGLSILVTTMWDRVFREKNPCAAAITEVEKREAKDK